MQRFWLSVQKKVMFHKPFKSLMLGYENKKKIKATAVILISLFSRGNDFQSTLS